MAGFTIVNAGISLLAVRPASDDSLAAIFRNVAPTGVVLDSIVANRGGSYDGRFNGPDGAAIWFRSIERFGFIDRAGGNDTISTFEGNDTLDGGAGDDLLHGGAGIDRIDGGAGMDRAGVYLNRTSSKIAIDLNFAVSRFLEIGRFEGIEGFRDLRTGSGRDVITGHRTARLDDEISTAGGNDHITLFSGGIDIVDGGAGRDLLELTWDIASGGVVLDSVVAGSGGSWSGRFIGIDSGAHLVAFSGIEDVQFTDAAGGNDSIATFDGDDRLYGGGGATTCCTPGRG